MRTNADEYGEILQKYFSAFSAFIRVQFIYHLELFMTNGNEDRTRTSTDERGDKKYGSLSPIELKHKDITDKILQAFFKIVYPRLGYGFLEKVYENALAISLQEMGLKVRQQEKIAVYFQDHIEGEYSADLAVKYLTTVEKRSLGRNKLT